MMTHERITPLGSESYRANAGEYIQLMQVGKYRAICQYLFTDPHQGCEWISALCDSANDARDELLTHCAEEHSR